MTAKPKSIDILEAHRTRKSICITWQQGDGSFELAEPDNPLPAFTKAFDALTALVTTIIHVPKEWAANLRVTGLKMSKQGGADQVSFVFRKGLDDASKEFVAVTPPRLLAHPTEPGSYTPPLTNAEAALVWEAVEQAKAYVKGDRAQGVISFDDDENEGGEGEGDDQLGLGKEEHERSSPEAMASPPQTKKRAPRSRKQK
jgi:hypothetical protein